MFRIMKGNLYLKRVGFEMTSDINLAFICEKESFAIAWCKVVNNYCKIQNPIQHGRFDAVIGCEVVKSVIRNIQ